MVANLSQHINASQGLAPATEDVFHIWRMDVRPVQVTLLLGEIAEQHSFGLLGQLGCNISLAPAQEVGADEVSQHDSTPEQHDTTTMRAR